MTIEEKKLDGYITLKEASELFGYSPDYIGQLIRKGKIEGKQVYANVAWMTTINTLEEYLARERGATILKEKPPVTLRLMQLLVSEQSVQVARWTLRVLIPLLVIIAALVFYFISISIDRKLTHDAEERLNARTASIVIPTETGRAYLSYEK